MHELAVPMPNPAQPAVGAPPDLAELRSRAARHAIDGRVELINDPAVVPDRLDGIIAAARRQICSLVPASALLGAQMRDGSHGAPRSSVGVRTVWSTESAATSPVRARIAGFVERGYEVRVHPAPPMRLLLIDDRIGVVAADPSDPLAGYYLLLCPGLVGPLTALFGVIWQHARPLTAPELGGAPQPSPGLRLALIMLSEGSTDEAIARRLGVTSRTVRRWLAEAMQQLEATSRFELGVAAARAGWLPRHGSAV